MCACAGVSDRMPSESVLRGRGHGHRRRRKRGRGRGRSVLHEQGTSIAHGQLDEFKAELEFGTVVLALYVYTFADRSPLRSG